MELVKEKIHLNRLVGAEDVQLLVEGDIIVPDANPDIAELLVTEEAVVLGRVEAGTDRVAVSGTMTLSVLYTAKSGGGVASLTHLRELDDFVNMDGVTKDADPRVTATIANIDYKLTNDRKISYRAVVMLSLRCESEMAHDVVVHMGGVPSNQLLTAKMGMTRTVARQQESFTLRDTVRLPGSKPAIREMLHFSASLADENVRVTTARVTLSGQVKLSALYRGDEAEGLPEFYEFELPFNGPIDVEGARDDMLADARLVIESATATPAPDDDGEDRVLEVVVSIGARVSVTAGDTLSVLEDAYIPGKTLTAARSTVALPRLVCTNRNQAQVKEIVTLGEEAPDMLQVFRVLGRAHLDDVEVVEDKIIAEGAITTDILYVAGSDDAQLAAYRTVIPYSQTIEVKGAAPGMDVDMSARVEHVAFNMLAPREVEVRLGLTFATGVTHLERYEIVSDIEVTDACPHALASQASLTIYVVQPGDTLWKIAKAFHTPLDDLLAVNDLDSGTKLTPGQKLLVLKQ
jgi:hypothetical protein